jgi:phosphoserine phosphatase RsbU/P
LEKYRNYWERRREGRKTVNYSMPPIPNTPNPGDSPVQAARHQTGLITIVFTDLVGSTALKQHVGDRSATSLIQQHHALVRELLRGFNSGEEIETAGDSFLIVFTSPSDAVHFGLLLHARLRALNQSSPARLEDRIGIHVGEVVIRAQDGSVNPKGLTGIQVDTCARVMDLAKGGQILLTRSAFDNARQMFKGQEVAGVGSLAWLNHGSYLLKGIEAPLEVFEVGEVGIAPLKAPAGSEKAQRQATPASTGPIKPVAEKRADEADLSRMRHELRTPINHILGYCEMLMEEGQLPQDAMDDLRHIHSGGRQLQSLIARYFDEDQFFLQRDLHQLYHELRTPVNHIVGYSDLLIEQAEDPATQAAIPDLQKIRDAADNWLALMEAYLIEPILSSGIEPGDAPVQPVLPNLGISFKVPEPKTGDALFKDDGAILIADDDESSREMLARRLRRSGYAVSALANGVQALALARRQKFDLVLLDMIMPGLDGFQVLAKFKADPALREIPVIMLSALDEENGIARSIEMGAEDYLAKPFNPAFLRARIGACLERKRLRDKEKATHLALLNTQKRLAAELAGAAAYVRSMLPAALTGAVQSEWCFQPSEQLGGDAFGHHWLDGDHLAIYLLDVSGHGVGAALLSVSIMSSLRMHTLPGTDFREPTAVLSALNKAFRAADQQKLFFSMWYGVYTIPSRELSYSSGGHPPGLLLSENQTQCLSTEGPAIGKIDDVKFTGAQQSISPGARLLLFSDGVFEVSQGGGRVGTWREFLTGFELPEIRNLRPAERLERALKASGAAGLQDDFSLLELRFA